MRLVIFSGLSGAGKGVALHALEDLGYHCVDNLPLDLLPGLAAQVSAAGDSRRDRVAVVIDARNLSRDFEAFPEALAAVAACGVSAEVVYLEARVDILIQRFSETRRRHPLTGGDCTLQEAIAREASLLEPVRRAADLRIDTTLTRYHELRDLIRRRVGEREGNSPSLQFESFGFKRGVPLDADMVFDARCLPNPYWQAELRDLDGRDAPVRQFLEAEPQVHDMFTSVEAFLTRWLPAFAAANRAYLTVAMGCTGGRHRSVYLAERLAERFADGRREVIVRHREL